MRHLHAIIVLIGLCLSAGTAGADANPYHWEGQEQFYEGWYFKVSDPATQRSYLFIYAVLNPSGNSPYSQAFMMAANNSPGSAAGIFQAYDASEFSSRPDIFDTWVGSANHAGGDSETLRAEGSVADGSNRCSWEIELSVKESWPDTMGWMERLPGLQTYWYVHALDARASGWVRWNDEVFEFQDIRGYQEKNWGEEFPETWYWLQANHFDDPDACCLSVGGGSMPLGPGVFDACGIGFRYNGELYTFSFPQNITLIDYEIEPGAWMIEAQRGGHRIQVEGWCALNELINLMNPTAEGIKPHTWETVTGTVRVRLYRRSGRQWVELADTTSDLAGLELGGAQWALGPW